VLVLELPTLVNCAWCMVYSNGKWSIKSYSYMNIHNVTRSLPLSWQYKEAIYAPVTAVISSLSQSVALQLFEFH